MRCGFYVDTTSEPLRRLAEWDGSIRDMLAYAPKKKMSAQKEALRRGAKRNAKAKDFKTILEEVMHEME